MKRMAYTMLGLLLLAAGTSGCERPAWWLMGAKRATVTDSVFGSVYAESVFVDLYGQPEKKGAKEEMLRPSETFEPGIRKDNGTPLIKER